MDAFSTYLYVFITVVDAFCTRLYVFSTDTDVFSTGVDAFIAGVNALSMNVDAIITGLTVLSASADAFSVCVAGNFTTTVALLIMLFADSMFTAATGIYTASMSRIQVVTNMNTVLLMQKWDAEMVMKGFIKT